MKTSDRKGFTLIEMLIVIAIIGILAVGLGRIIVGGPQKARDASRKNAISQITQALEAHNGDKGGYPGTAGSAQCLESIAAIQNYFPGGKFPTDPSGKQTFGATVGASCDFGYVKFASSVTNANYAVFTKVEDTNQGNTVEPVAAVTTTIPSSVASGAYYFVVQ